MIKYKPVNLLSDTYDNPIKQKKLFNPIGSKNEQIDRFYSNITEEERIALPQEQTISVDSIKLNKSNKTYRKSGVNQILGTLNIADDALASSILSYAIYERNLWTISDINKPMEEMTVKIEQGLRDKNALYNLKTWHFIKSFFNQIPDKDFEIKSTSEFFNENGERIKYQFKNGQYTALNGLAHAVVLKSQHPSGEGYVLHVVFRGTEFSKIKNYITNAYLDIPEYVNSFKPFTEAIKQYAEDPKNNIKEVHNAGHSLGGAVAQLVMSNYEDNHKTGLKYKGFTFGSPGAKKSLMFKFLSVGYNAVFKGKFKWDNTENKNDSRIHEFYHNNDPVPKIGLLGYERSGIIHNLFDQAQAEEREANLDKKTFIEKFPFFGKIIETMKNNLDVSYHDSKRYALNLRALIENHYSGFPTITNKLNTETYSWQQYIIAEDNFKKLGMKYKIAFEQWIVAQNPNVNKSSKLIKDILENHLTNDSEAKQILSEKSENNIEVIDYIKNDTNIINFAMSKKAILDIRQKALENNEVLELKTLKV